MQTESQVSRPALDQALPPAARLETMPGAWPCLTLPSHSMSAHPHLCERSLSADVAPRSEDPVPHHCGPTMWAPIQQDYTTHSVQMSRSRAPVAQKPGTPWELPATHLTDIGWAGGHPAAIHSAALGDRSLHAHTPACVPSGGSFGHGPGISRAASGWERPWESAPHDSSSMRGAALHAEQPPVPAGQARWIGHLDAFRPQEHNLMHCGGVEFGLPYSASLRENVQQPRTRSALPSLAVDALFETLPGVLSCALQLGVFRHACAPQLQSAHSC